MAATTRKILLPILFISIALFLPAQAQYASYDDKDGGDAAASDSVVVSYISATPEASPAAAPGLAPEASVSIDVEPSDPAPADSYDASLAIEPSEPSSSGDATPSSGDATSSSGDATSTVVVTPWRETDNLDTEPIMSHDVPAEKRKSINMFVQSTMQVTEAKTQNFIDTVIEKRLEDPQIGTFTKDCLLTCKEVYEDSKSAMKKTLEDINEGNYFKANVDVSAISSDAETCKECVKMVYGKDQELDKFNKWVDGVIDQCLTMITGYKA